MPRIYCFTHATLLAALADWQQQAVDAYPHQSEKIALTVQAMLDLFADEDLVRRHKLNVPEAEAAAGPTTRPRASGRRQPG